MIWLADLKVVPYIPSSQPTMNIRIEQQGVCGRGGKKKTLEGGDPFTVSVHISVMC